MIKVRYFPFLFLILISFYAKAQQPAWVFFRDKKGVTFDPYTYFEQTAVERRKREGLSLYDSTDFPVREDYVTQINAASDSLLGVSRWFNAAACILSADQMEKIARLPFVKSVTPMIAAPALCHSSSAPPELSEEEEALLRAQTERMHYSLLREKGYTGRGVRIAVFDAGFKGIPIDSAFSHLVKNNQIKATYDFVKDKKFVFGYHGHGSEVLSCITGIWQGVPMGCATGADFLLARTEQAFNESMVRENNWVESLEWADKWGADIVNSSLSYTRQLYFRSDMDGKSSLISKAAALANQKGILVVNSAGNEAESQWEIIGAPADADSVLTIGGIDPWTGYHSYFSSFGPTSDKRLKPNLSAFGWAMASVEGKMEMVSGTSFSSPLVAGFAACIWQMHPEWTVKQLFDELQKSGDLYPYYDYAHGYGVPQSDYFLDGPQQMKDPTLTSYFDSETDCFEFERIAEDSLVYTDFPVEMTDSLADGKIVDLAKMRDFVYLHVEMASGVLQQYRVFKPGEKWLAYIDNPKCDDCIIRVFYKGYILEIGGKKKNEE